jgi:hypothetical protein
MSDGDAYLLLISKGEYDDHISIPIAVTKDRDTAELLQTAFESIDRTAINTYCPSLWNLIGENSLDQFSIDIDTVPIISL